MFLDLNLRVGAVSYLNTKPLVEGLLEIAPALDLRFDLPSRLADDLAAGTLDVALIPSIEFFQNPDYELVSNACIGCRGSVLSVKLLSRVPMHGIRTLALDEGSRTSAALTKILLRERFGITPQCERLPIGSGAEDTATDAVLLIGDRAIHSPQAGFVEEWDLGDQWCRWSELPFVFAVWTARPGLDTGDMAQALEQARDRGVANLARIAAEQGPRVGLTEEQCLSYLRDNLYFYFGPRERRGWELFREHARRLGLAPTARPRNAAELTIHENPAPA
jgi:chorismate dehydratase